MPKDEYGIEFSEDVDRVLKDPKSTVISDVFSYLSKREVARKEKEDKEKAPLPREKVLGIF